MWSTTASLRAALGPAVGLVGVEHVAGGDLQPVPARLEVVGDQVAGDGDQPGAEVAALPGEAADALERPQERVGGQVLGQRPVADPEVDEPEHGVHVAVVDAARTPRRRRPGPARPAPTPRPRRRRAPGGLGHASAVLGGSAPRLRRWPRSGTGSATQFDGLLAGGRDVGRSLRPPVQLGGGSARPQRVGTVPRWRRPSPAGPRPCDRVMSTGHVAAVAGSAPPDLGGDMARGPCRFDAAPRRPSAARSGLGAVGRDFAGHIEVRHRCLPCSDGAG